MANNPTDVFSRTIATWSLPMGVDISGKGRSFTSLNGIAAGGLDSISAGVFAATSYARLTNPLFLSLADLSFEFIINPTTITGTGNILRAGSVTAVNTYGLALRITLISGKFYWGMLKRGMFNNTVLAQQVTEGTDDPVTFNQPYHLVFVAANGVNNRIFVNGSEIATTSTNTQVSNGAILGPGGLTGPVPIISDWELSIGDPSTAQNTFLGTLGRVIAHPYAMSLNQAGVNSRLQFDQQRVVGLGAESAAGVTNRGPVAVPDMAGPVSGDGGSTIDIDVATRSFDANSDLLTAVVPSQGERGVSSIVSNKLRYQPSGTTVNVIDTVPFSVRDPSLLQSKPSIIRVSVTGSTIEDYFYPKPTDTIRNSYGSGAGFRDLYVRVGGGNQLVFDPAGGGDLTFAISNANDGDRIIVKNGAHSVRYASGEDQLYKKSGEVGRIQILADNPVFTDLSLTSPAGSDMVGAKTNNSNTASFLRSINFNSFNGLWIEGFRCGDLNLSNRAAGADGQILFGSGTYANNESARCWVVKNFFHNAQGGVYRIYYNNGRSVYYRNFSYCNETLVQDYHVFLEGKPTTTGSPFLIKDTYVIQNIFRGQANQVVSAKGGNDDVFIHGNMFHHTETVDGKEVGTIIVCGQSSDKPSSDAAPGEKTVRHMIISFNKFNASAAGFIACANVQDVEIFKNEFNGDGVFELFTLSKNTGIVLPPHPRKWQFYQNTFLGSPGNFGFVFGRTWVDESAQRHDILINNNVTSNGNNLKPSQIHTGENISGGADFSSQSKIYLKLGTNSKCPTPPANTILTIV